MKAKILIFIGLLVPMTAWGQDAQPDAVDPVKIDPVHPIPAFKVFEYNPSDRDPFISPQAVSLLVSKKPRQIVVGNTETLESLMKKLETDLRANCKVLGISVDVDPRMSSALVSVGQAKIGENQLVAPSRKPQKPDAKKPPELDGAPAMAQATGKSVAGATPPSSTSQTTQRPPDIIIASEGFPIRAATGTDSYVQHLAQKIAVESGTRLLRDVRRGMIYVPIEKITESGIYITIPGAKEPISLPFSENFDTDADYDKPQQQTNARTPLPALPH